MYILNRILCVPVFKPSPLQGGHNSPLIQCNCLRIYICSSPWAASCPRGCNENSHELLHTWIVYIQVLGYCSPNGRGFRLRSIWYKSRSEIGGLHPKIRTICWGTPPDCASAARLMQGLPTKHYSCPGWDRFLHFRKDYKSRPERSQIMVLIHPLAEQQGPYKVKCEFWTLDLR